MSSVEQAEIEHFAKDSHAWWDESGAFAPLHRLNPVRMKYIVGQLETHFDRFEGLSILDIGCGGGLVCEPLARLGAKVAGIDADRNAIATAQDHAERQGLKIDYKVSAAEDMKKTFDVVLALEIVEHVKDVDSFIQTCVGLCKPNGLLIFSTLNRTAKSFALGIVAAEYVVRWVPQGTHNWKKFVKPSELAQSIRRAGAQEQNIKGLVYRPFFGDFDLSDTDIDVNYFLSAVKP